MDEYCENLPNETRLTINDTQRSMLTMLYFRFMIDTPPSVVAPELLLQHIIFNRTASVALWQ